MKNAHVTTAIAAATVITLALGACATQQKPAPSLPTEGALMQALSAPEAPEPAAAPEPAVQREAPPAPTAPLAAPALASSLPNETRVSIAMNNAPARQFFMALTAGTPYTLLVHPNVTGTYSARLQDVTVPEALEAIRDLYDLDITLSGKRITVKQPAMETRVFQVNYPNGTRKGSSDTRVSAGSLSDPVPTGAVAGSVPGNPAQAARLADSSRVSTSAEADFWQELKASLEAVAGIVMGNAGNAGNTGNAAANNNSLTGIGKSIVISPQSGVVVARAMPRELRDIAAYLKATQLSIERQVILEAKIIEVQLSDSFQSGVNWAAFRNSGTRATAGVIQPGAALNNTPDTPLTNGNLSGTAGDALSALSTSGGTMFGLALQGTNFAALISFLETQGAVQVLSSPRISTLNNQQAVLKVGTDEFFVTGVSGGTTTPSAGGAITTTPNVTLRPFFSGVVLDVLPQIDADGNIMLHVRPSVSQVSTVNKNINLGVGGQLSLPLATSSASEADSVVRAKNGQVVVIGGLMREGSNSDRSQVPGVGNAPGIGKLFGSTSRSSQKRELVILLKPTVIQSDAQWNDDLTRSRQRVQQMSAGSVR